MQFITENLPNSLDLVLPPPPPTPSEPNKFSDPPPSEPNKFSDPPPSEEPSQSIKKILSMHHNVVGRELRLQDA